MGCFEKEFVKWVSVTRAYPMWYIYTFPPPKNAKVDLTTDAEYVANLVNVNMWL